MGRIYRIDHQTRYVYASVVNTSQHVAWLEPRALGFQQVHSYAIAIDPLPARELRRTDYFGNAVHQFQLLRPHGELSVVTHSEVEVHPRRTAPLEPSASPPWEEGRRSLHESPADRSVAEFLYQSPQTTGAPEIGTYARDSFPEGRTVLEGAIDLMHRIHREFIFDPAATNPATPVSRVLDERRGVCQDFAHFQIACLRSLGLAARYVSGYILTDPPPGQARLIGADASHAWLSVYCPVHGWVDLDPTNDVVAEDRHITVAWGRDFSDVTPLRGVLLGGAEHQLFVGVSVVPVGPDLPEAF